MGTTVRAPNNTTKAQVKLRGGSQRPFVSSLSFKGAFGGSAEALGHGSPPSTAPATARSTFVAVKPSEQLRRLWRDDGAFAEHRLRTILIAVLVAAGSVAALVWGPDDPSDRLATVWTTVFSAVLSLALITLIYEMALRQSHAIALRRFLRLNSTVVHSGLQSIEEDSDVEWRELFTATSSATFVLASPYPAVGYLKDLIRAGRDRALKIRFCLPDIPAEAEMDEQSAARVEALTRAVGADQRIGSAIGSTIEDLVSTFERESSQLAAGSTMDVAVYDVPVFMEGVLLDRATVAMPIPAAGRPRGSSASCMVFVESQSLEIRRLRDSLEAIADAAVEVESKQSGAG